MFMYTYFKYQSRLSAKLKVFSKLYAFHISPVLEIEKKFMQMKIQLIVNVAISWTIQMEKINFIYIKSMNI